MSQGVSGCPRHVERNYVPLFGVVKYHCSAWHNRTSTYVITYYHVRLLFKYLFSQRVVIPWNALPEM